MKKCPVCSRTYTDETIAFCLEDGTALKDFFSHSSVTQQYNPNLPFTNQPIPDTLVTHSNNAQNPARLRVSILARLITAFCYAIPAIGGALSSILLIDVFQALRSAESAGIAALMGGMKEASVPVFVSLYLAAVCGIGVIIVLIVRNLVQTKTASPPFWFYIVSGILSLIPAGLFWKAQALVIDVLSPGSSVGAGGVGAVGAQVSELLILSVISALVVFVLLIVAAVIPFSASSKPKWLAVAAATLIVLLFIASAIGIPNLIGEPKRKNETVKLPENVKYVEYDYDIDRETSMVLTLSSDNKLYLRQQNSVPGKSASTENIITKEDLPEKIKNFSAEMPPDKQIVYLKADVNASYENVLQVFDVIRKTDIDKVGLVVIGEKNLSDPYQTHSARFEVKLPAPVENKNEILRPNPLTLVAVLKPDGSMMLNYEEMGKISDPKRLENRLLEVFKDRESNGVFREGTNEVEKTVFLKVSKSIKYGDFIKLVETVKNAGAEPIGIQIDDLNL